MIRNYFIIRLLILLILAGSIAGGVSDGRWLPAGSAQAGNNPAPFEPAIDDGSGNEISMPTGPPKPGYQWVLRRMPTNKTFILPDGYKLERQPRYIEKWKPVGWTEKKVAVYHKVTENEGWDYYTVEVPVHKTVPYVKYYRPVPVLRKGVIESSGREPVYGSKRIQTGTRKETRRRPRWVTYQEFSHWKTVKEPKYGWVMEQDGWEEPRLVSNFVSKTVPGSALVWRQEPMPWEPGTAPDWLPEPDWLTEGSWPPWIPKTLWDLLSLDDRQAILHEARGVWEKAILERISSDSPLGQQQAREMFEAHQLWGDFPKKMWVPGFDVPLHHGSAGIGEAAGKLSNWDIVYWTGRIHIKEGDSSVWYYISEEPDGGGLAGWADSKNLAAYVNSSLNDDTTDYWLQEHRVRLEGNWSPRNRQAVAEGIMAVGKKLSEIIGGTPQDAFLSVFDHMSFYWGNDTSGLTSECRSITAGACTSSPHLINFMSMARSTSYRSEELAFALARNNVVHELGHAFANLWWSIDPESKKPDYPDDGPYKVVGAYENREVLSNEGFHPSPDAGRLLWRQHPQDHPTANEVFADMFLGWAFDTWADDSPGTDRDAFITTHMEEWIQQIVNR